MVPFNLAGLATAKGGNAAMNHYLDDTLRSYTGADGYAWVGNEPSIELPREYDTPGGLADGNDDLERRRLEQRLRPHRGDHRRWHAELHPGHQREHLLGAAAANQAPPSYPGNDSATRTLGKCLDVTNNGTTNGSPVELWQCTGGNNQKWTAGANGSPVNPSSNLCPTSPPPISGPEMGRAGGRIHISSR
jgi:Ricin-type beta-trefoil lectin domain